MKAFFKALVVSITVVSFLGCSFFASKTQMLSVTTSPTGADVYVNGEYAGESPVQHRIDRDEEASIMAEMDGRQAMTRSTSRRLSTTGILDIIGGVLFLLPFLGLLAPGAWDQEPENLSITLPEAG